jgi:hypothetical protein
MDVKNSKIKLCSHSLIFKTRILLIVVEKRVFARISQKVVLNFIKSKEKSTSVLHNPKDLKHEALVVHSILNEGVSHYNYSVETI